MKTIVNLPNYLNYNHLLTLTDDLTELQLTQTNMNMIIKDDEISSYSITIPTTPSDIIYIRDYLNILIENNENKYYLEESFVKLRSLDSFDKNIIEEIIECLSKVKGINQLVTQEIDYDLLHINFSTNKFKYYLEYYKEPDDVNDIVYLVVYDKKEPSNLLRFFKEDNIKFIFENVYKQEEINLAK